MRLGDSLITHDNDVIQETKHRGLQVLNLTVSLGKERGLQMDTPNTCL